MIAVVRRLDANERQLGCTLSEFNLPPYDGVDRYYNHTDADPATGRAIVARLLGLPEPPSGEGLFYDLHIYSGGCGVLNRLAITIPGDPRIWIAARAALQAREPEDAAIDVGWAEDFIWLLNGEEQALPIRDAAARFINSERRSFQLECTSRSTVLFQTNSDVNDWAVIWGHETHVNYLGYSQG